MKIEYDRVERIQRSDGGDFWIAEGSRTDDDGSTTRHRYMFPADTLEWRAAEYGIDPTGTATLLDIVLAEPFLTDEDWSAGAVLHTAPDIETARVDHIARCANAKLRHRISTRGAGHPCRRIAIESPLDPEALELKRQIVENARAKVAAEQAAPPVDRLAELRAAAGRSAAAASEPPTRMDRGGLE